MQQSMVLSDAPHRRFNPLTQEWVLVSPDRASRPWLGQVDAAPAEDLPAYDPACYLCPGNARAGGVRNPEYVGTFVFDNDFPALHSIGTAEDASRHALLAAQTEPGICRVACFSPRHDLSLPELPPSEVEAVVATWVGQTVDLSARDEVGFVQVFENKGAMMGASNPHPHSQIWANAHLPTEPAKELRSQLAYKEAHGRPLLLDYLHEEQRQRDRLVATTADFTALVPFWAVWPFEVIVLPHRPVGSLFELSEAEVSSLAEMLRQVTTRYDNLFEVSFPYSMGFHQAPCDDRPHPEWQLHAHFYPPLLRSATIRKFLVGYELLAQPQRDLTAEYAADRLRALPDIHYRNRSRPIR